MDTKAHIQVSKPITRALCTCS